MFTPRFVEHPVTCFVVVFLKTAPKVSPTYRFRHSAHFIIDKGGGGVTHAARQTRRARDAGVEQSSSPPLLSAPLSFLCHAALLWIQRRLHEGVFEVGSAFYSGSPKVVTLLPRTQTLIFWKQVSILPMGESDMAVYFGVARSNCRISHRVNCFI